MYHKQLYATMVFVLVLSTCLIGQSEAPFKQDSGADGIVMVEAEHFHENVEVGGHSWEETGPVGGFTGEIGMICTDGNGSHGNSGYATTSEHLDYKIEFVKTGTHYIWLQGFGADGSADSCNLGLDGEEYDMMSRLTGYNGNYRWYNDNMHLDTAPQVEITEAGVHTLSLYVREDGFIADRILLTTNPDYVPTGDGPPESVQGAQPKAGNPIPQAGGDDIPKEVVLSWTPGEFAVKHNVYFSHNFDDVNTASAAALVGDGQTATSLDIGILNFSNTYYWRVDEVNGAPDNTVFPGGVWSFEVEPEGIPMQPIAVTASAANPDMEPEKTIDGSGMANGLHDTEATNMWLALGDVVWIQYEFAQAALLNEMLVWNSNQMIEAFIGFGMKTVVVETSMDGENWTAVEGATEFARGTGIQDYAANTVVNFAGAVAKYVKITGTAAHGFTGQMGLSEVQFTATPVTPRELSPADGASAEDLDVSLTWRAGRFAVEHQLLMSENIAAVEDGSALLTTTTDLAYVSEEVSLDYGAAYFWQVINVADDGATYPSDIMLLNAPTTGTIDDMEGYKDAEFFEIWASWLDGTEFGTDDPDNGSIVGANPAADDYTPGVGRGGGQSLPINYDNTTASKSEAIRIFDPALDLTVGNPEDLSIYFQGSPAPYAEADGVHTISAWGADIWNQADEFRFVYKKLSGDGSITARIDSMINADVWTKGGVMIRNDLTPESMNSYSFASTGGRAGVQFRDISSNATISTRNDADGSITLPFWVRLTRTGNVFAGERSDDGVTWTAMFEEANPDETGSANIAMNHDVYVGLAVTSHTLNAATVAEISNVTTTGNVTGAWTAEAIGGVHPANDTAQVYMTIADSRGKETTVEAPAGSTQLGEWTRLAVALSDLGDVDPSRIESIAVGVQGVGTTGQILLDDIEVQKVN